MNYVSPESARHQGGLRLALTAGVPGPYSMAARAIFDHHRVEYIAVEQLGGGANESLVDWCGHRNAPVAIYENEAPRASWLEILMLAERLGSGTSLLPGDIETRIKMIGMCQELLGENGLLWNMRLLMLGIGGPERAAREARKNPMYKDYGYSERARSDAQARIDDFLDCFTEHLETQRANGTWYLAGDQFCALDIYWAYCSQIFSTLPDEDCPMPGFLRKSYDLGADAAGGCHTVLIEQRDYIFSEHLPLPMTF